MEEEKEIFKLIKNSPEILSMIYKDLAQPGVKEVGRALKTVLEFSNSILLPVKLLNSKFRLNFEKRLSEYKEKLNQIPKDDLCEVNPQVGTPIIDKLSYTTNKEIADLFTNLLAKASSTKTVNQAHPSFIQLIERISVDEARIIKYLKDKDYIPSISFHAFLTHTGGFITILNNGTLIPTQVSLVFPKIIKTYLDNLTSLGILDNSHGNHKNDDEIYKPLIQSYDFNKISKDYKNREMFSKVEIQKGYYQITDYGRAFIQACTS